MLLIGKTIGMVGSAGVATGATEETAGETVGRMLLIGRTIGMVGSAGVATGAAGELGELTGTVTTGTICGSVTCGRVTGEAETEGSTIGGSVPRATVATEAGLNATDGVGAWGLDGLLGTAEDRVTTGEGMSVDRVGTTTDSGGRVSKPLIAVRPPSPIVAATVATDAAGVEEAGSWMTTGIVEIPGTGVVGDVATTRLELTATASVVRARAVEGVVKRPPRPSVTPTAVGRGSGNCRRSRAGVSSGPTSGSTSVSGATGSGPPGRRSGV
jgi:hypothetical protein